MKELIEAAAREAKISQIGFARAEVFSDLGAVLAESDEVPMAEQDIEKRINPFLIMEDAKTIIACLCSYYCGERKGNLSKYARGIDYHFVMNDKLSKICDVLVQKGYKAQMFSDSGALNDRYIGVRAGLGFIGKNGFLINEKLGTYTFIGYIITDCEIEPSESTPKSCLGCRKCIKACPTGALGECGTDGYKCLSYITQKKGELTQQEQELMRKCGTVWGCDICQDVCPHNADAEQTDIDEFREDLIDTLKLDSNISNKEFRRIYGKRAFAWRGKAVLVRNLEILAD